MNGLQISTPLVSQIRIHSIPTIIFMINRYLPQLDYINYRRVRVGVQPNLIMRMALDLACVLDLTSLIGNCTSPLLGWCLRISSPKDQSGMIDVCILSRIMSVRPHWWLKVATSMFDF